jgi:hypothetical protein
MQLLPSKYGNFATWTLQNEGLLKNISTLFCKVLEKHYLCRENKDCGIDIVRIL